MVRYAVDHDLGQACEDGEISQNTALLMQIIRDLENCDCKKKGGLILTCRDTESSHTKPSQAGPQ